MLAEQTRRAAARLRSHPVADAADVLGARGGRARRLRRGEPRHATSSRCCATRAPTRGSTLGASPRAGIALLRVAKALALADAARLSRPRRREGGRGARARAPADPRAGGSLRRPRRRRARRRRAGKDSRPGMTEPRPRRSRARPRRLRRRVDLRLARALSRRDRARLRGRRRRRAGSVCRRARRSSAATARPRRARGRRRARRAARSSRRPRVPPPSLVAHETLGRLGERRVDLARAGRRRFTGAYELARVPRGRYAFESVRLSAEDPFGARADGDRCRPARRRSSSIRGSSRSSGCSRRAARTPQEGRRLLLRRPSGFELHSVREYEQGESLRKRALALDARTAGS